MNTLEQTLQDAIDIRDSLRPDYRRAINPNNHLSAATAQRIEAEYAAASEAVKVARRNLRAAQKEAA
jgi:hypothetical protein